MYAAMARRRDYAFILVIIALGDGHKAYVECMTAVGTILLIIFLLERYKEYGLTIVSFSFIHQWHKNFW